MQRNTVYAFDGTNFFVWGQSGGNIGWIRIDGIPGSQLFQMFQSGQINYSNLEAGTWAQGLPPLTYTLVSTNFGDIGPAARRAVVGAPGAQQQQLAPFGGQQLNPQAANAPAWGNGAYNGPGTNSAITGAIAAMLLAQQGNTAPLSIMGAAAANMAAAATDEASGAALIQWGQGVALALGLNSTSGAAAAANGNPITTLLLSLIGTSGLTQLAQVLNTLSVTAVVPASQAALNTAFDVFVNGLRTVLSTINNNTLVTSLISNAQASGNVAMLLQVLLAQNAVTAFNSQVPSTAIGALIADLQARFVILNTGFQAFVSSMQTAALVSSLA